MNAQAKAIIKARNDGYVAGFQNCRGKALEFLAKKYMLREVGRGTPEGEAILAVARELSQALESTPVPDKDLTISG